MPIKYEIDPSRRIVFARAVGSLTKKDFFSYQKEVWSGPGVEHYDECVDMTEATDVEGATSRNLEALAVLSVKTDAARSSKLAIIATKDLFFGLGRMYETYRGMQPDNSRRVGIFRTRDEALRWLAEGTANS